MKVLQVSTIGFADPQYYRSHELTLSRSLVKLGHDVTLFAPDRHPKWQMLEDRTVERTDEIIDGFRIRRFPSGPEVGTVPLMPTLLGEIMKFDCDILHAHTILAPASFYSALASTFKRTPLIVTQHDYLYGNTHGMKLFIQRMNNNTFGRFTMHRASVVIGLTNAAVRFVRKFGAPGEKTIVVPNSVDTTTFRPNQRNILKERWGITGPIVLFVGRLVKDKGVDVLLRAFQESLVNAPGSKLVIVGKGPEERSLHRLQRKLGLKPVYFLGRVQREEMCHIYPGCDILVLPSLYEPFGNVVLEAMATGLPVIGSNIGGMADVITQGVTGYQIAPGNIKELSKHMISLLTDTRLRSGMSRAAREAAEKKFDDVVVARAVEKIYQKYQSA